MSGLAIGPDPAATFVPFNAADGWLHLWLGPGMPGLGLLPGRRPATRP